VATNRYAALSSGSTISVEAVSSSASFEFRTFLTFTPCVSTPPGLSPKSQTKSERAPTAPTSTSSRYATAITKEMILNA